MTKNLNDILDNHIGKGEERFIEESLLLVKEEKIDNTIYCNPY